MEAYVPSDLKQIEITFGVPSLNCERYGICRVEGLQKKWMQICPPKKSYGSVQLLKDEFLNLC